MSLAITQIYEQYYRYIYNYALKLTCQPEDALDITQETFIKAWRKLDSLEEEKAVAKWLRVICYHEFLMSLRDSKNFKTISEEEFIMLEKDGKLLVSDYPLPEEEVVVAEEIRNLQNGCFFAMVRKLTLNQRITFSLIDMFGLDTDYVAQLLGISKGATKGLLYRARMNLDSFFANHCNLLELDNPCSCKAWLTFSSNRDTMQKRAKQLTNHLDYREVNYEYKEKVRSKISYLYAHMPEYQPPIEWYEKVLKIISEN
jgi:RNA polymerase sigma factor (sigma-70 family)